MLNGRTRLLVIRNRDDAVQLGGEVCILRARGISDSILADAVKRARIFALDLTGCDRLTDRIADLAIYLPEVQSFNLSYCHLVTDKAVSAIAGLPRIKRVMLDYCYLITDASLYQLGLARNLTALSLLGCERVTDNGVKHLCRTGSLRKLRLPDFAKISDESLLTLSKCCLELHTLEFANLSQISDYGIRVLGNLPRLRQLKIVQCPNITERGVRALAVCSPLLHVSLVQ